MDAAILDIESDSLILGRQFLFNKKFLRNKEEIKLFHSFVPLYKIPVSDKEISEKSIKKVIYCLKKEGIRYIITTKKLQIRRNLSERLKKEFIFFDGSQVINYKIYDILRKCAAKKGIDLENSTVRLISNDAGKVKEFVLKFFRNVKKIEIVTDCEKNFTDLSEYFLEEYGLFLLINKEGKYDEKKITVFLDGGKKQSADLYFTEQKSSEIMFSSKNAFNQISSILNFNQESIEFFVYILYGRVCKETVKEFFKKYPTKIVKFGKL